MKIIGFILYFLILTILFVINYNFAYKKGYNKGNLSYSKGFIDGFDFAKKGDISDIFKDVPRLEKCPEYKEE